MLNLQKQRRGRHEGTVYDTNRKALSEKSGERDKEIRNRERFQELRRRCRLGSSAFSSGGQGRDLTRDGGRCCSRDDELDKQYREILDIGSPIMSRGISE
jgi:hypothetical protein